MKHIYLSITLALSIAVPMRAYDVALFGTNEGNSVGMHIDNIARVAHNEEKTAIIIAAVNGTTAELALSLEPRLTFAHVDERVDVTFGTEGITYANPISDKAVSVAIKGDKVTVKSLGEDAITIRLTGTSASGYVEIDNAGPLTLILDNLNLRHASKATVKVEGTADVDLVLVGTNRLVTEGVKKHAVSLSGNVNITGDSLEMEVYGDQSKCIKADGSVVIDGAQITGHAAGNVVIEDGDTSYCTVIKTDGDFTMKAGTLNLSCTGRGGKGISADGDAHFYAGEASITCTGDGDVYVNADGENEAYSSTCITIDGNLNIYGGRFTLNNAGSGGKCIKVDMDLTIGMEATSDDDLYIEAMTTGQRFVENAGSGWGDDTDYANPKVIAAEGNVTVLSGTLRLTSTRDGGEGLESKNTLTIAGGDIDISTVDDAMNASTHIQIDGGTIHCISSGNDGIDSNGTFTMNGGTLFTAGSRAPEGGIDCDNNRLAINGGVIVGMGGDTSSPTAAACSQRVVVYTIQFAKDSMLTIVSPEGYHVLSVTSPVNIGSCRLFISSPGLMEDGQYSIFTGGTVTSGTTSYNITTDGQYTPGTLATSFTPTSMVTTIGGGGGRPPR